MVAEKKCRAPASDRATANNKTGRQDRNANADRRPRAWLRIGRQRLYWDRFYWSLWLHDDSGSKKSLVGFDERRAVRDAALHIAMRLHLPVRGRWSGFYKKFRRAQAALRQQRIARRAAKRASEVAS
jgi:hypothetical protein